MKNISVKKLHPGMITAEDVYAFDGKLIVPAGIVLTENIILKMDSFDVFSVKIADEQITASAEPEESSLSYNQKIRMSPEFKQFKKSYESKIEAFRSSFNDLVTHAENVDMNESLSQALELLVESGNAVSLMDMLRNMRDYDDSTYAHSINVALICNIFAGWLHFSEDEKKLATACGLFHDLGKLTIPDKIIKKPGKLTEKEFEIVKRHPIEGYKILERLNVNQDIMDAALMHHEKCDGSGYPYGFQSANISRYAKLVTIVDIYDAMTSARVYRQPLNPFDVITEFENYGLQKYDPHFILTFLENVVNSYINQRVRLSNGMEGDVIFINPVHLGRPTVKVGSDFIDLSTRKELDIEALL